MIEGGTQLDSEGLLSLFTWQDELGSSETNLVSGAINRNDLEIDLYIGKIVELLEFLLDLSTIQWLVEVDSLLAFEDICECCS